MAWLYDDEKKGRGEENVEMRRVRKSGSVGWKGRDEEEGDVFIFRNSFKGYVIESDGKCAAGRLDLSL